MRDPNERGWKRGWYQCTVCWLEQRAADAGTTVRVKTFYDEAEMSAHMEWRIEMGVFHSIAWSMETYLGGRGHPQVPVYTEEEWEDMIGRANTGPTVSNEAGERDRL